MGKQQKGAAAKYVQAAAELQKKKNRQLIVLIAAAVFGVALWALYTYVLHDMLPNQQLDSILVYASVLGLVIVIGEVGNKFAQLNSEYRKLINVHGVTKQQIETYLKNH